MSIIQQILNYVYLLPFLLIFLLLEGGGGRGREEGGDSPALKSSNQFETGIVVSKLSL